jgi:hypothetical protein
MSLPEVYLRAAAGDIDQMPSTEVEAALRRVKERRNARTQIERLQQENELASLDLERAAYQLAGEAEEKGDLRSAARWYTAAALNDFADASLKLGRVLDALAEKHTHTHAEGYPATYLVSEACRWYSDALGAGEPGAEELLVNLTDRLGTSPKNPDAAATVEPSPQPSGRLQPLRPPSSRMATDPGRTPAPEPQAPSGSPKNAHSNYPLKVPGQS